MEKEQEDYFRNSYIKFPKFLSGSSIKLIAILSMLVDHFAAVVLAKYYPLSPEPEKIYKIYEIMRAIGRLAFPLFCFFAVEGFLYSKNRMKYLLRLAIFAILSEPAFDMAFAGRWSDFTQQNVMITIFLGIIGLWLFEQIRKTIDSKFDKNPEPLLYIIAALPICGIAYIAHILNTDYEAFGIFTIAVIYMFKEYKFLAFLFGISVLVLGYKQSELPAFWSALPILFYSGKRGFGLKYFFYLFYPIHLAILAYLAMNISKFAEVAVG